MTRDEFINELVDDYINMQLDDDTGEEEKELRDAAIQNFIDDELDDILEDDIEKMRQEYINEERERLQSLPDDELGWKGEGQ
jgi:hypothetical protein